MPGGKRGGEGVDAAEAAGELGLAHVTDRRGFLEGALGPAPGSAGERPVWSWSQAGGEWRLGGLALLRQPPSTPHKSTGA